MNDSIVTDNRDISSEFALKCAISLQTNKDNNRQLNEKSALPHFTEPQPRQLLLLHSALHRF
jgi:hypothetical protein